MGKMYTMTSETRNPEGYDVKEMLEMLRTAGYCMDIKIRSAQKTDWEKRIKYLEGVNAPKQKHEEMAIK